jgi:hypothetical protein
MQQRARSEQKKVIGKLEFIIDNIFVELQGTLFNQA